MSVVTDIPTIEAPAVEAAAPVVEAPAPVETLLGVEPAADPEADPAAEDAKDDAPGLTGAPEKYDFTMPEGVPFDTEAFAEFEPALRELDLNQDTAAKLVSAYAEKVMPVLQARAEKQGEEAGAQIRADWAREAQADKEIGGTKFEESKALAAKAMAKFMPTGEDGQKFRTFLNESGLGNHPEMIRMLSRAGRALGEAAVDPVTTGAAVETNPARIMYPNNPPKRA